MEIIFLRVELKWKRFVKDLDLSHYSPPNKILDLSFYKQVNCRYIT